MKETIELTISDDYAVLSAGGAQFYYGYEYPHLLGVETNGDEDEWGFSVNPGTGRWVHPLTATELRSLAGHQRLNTPEEHLLFGIGELLQRGVLALRIGGEQDAS